MIEMKSEIGRKVKFSQATKQAHKEGAFEMHDTMSNRLNAMREKQMHPRKSRLPLIIKIISGLSLIVFFFMPESEPLKRQISSQMQQSKQDIHAQQAVQPNVQFPGGNQVNDIEQALSNTVSNVSSDEKATVTVTIGGKTFTRELSAQEIQAMQQMQKSVH